MAGYIALSGGTFLFSVLVLLLGPWGARHDHVRRRISGIIGKSPTSVMEDEELSKPLSERLLRPAVRALSTKFLKYTSIDGTSRRDVQNPRRVRLQKMLRQAGLSIPVNEYSFIRFLIISGTAFTFWLIALLAGYGSRSVLGALMGLYTGYAGMRFWLGARISGRRTSMERQLPDVLDLLSVNVEAGLGFEQALLHVIGHFEGPVIDELTITYREMSMGRPRREALTLLAERCEFNEMKSFTSSVIQAEQLGIPMKNVLRTQASAMRKERRNKVEEKAMKISVKILLPLVGLIFPVLLIVLMGPAALRIIAVFQS